MASGKHSCWAAIIIVCCNVSNSPSDIVELLTHIADSVLNVCSDLCCEQVKELVTDPFLSLCLMLGTDFQQNIYCHAALHLLGINLRTVLFQSSYSVCKIELCNVPSVGVQYECLLALLLSLKVPL